jgi:hypothetical protein
VRAADGAGAAAISTGTAVAVGNVASTTITQAAAGQAAGGGTATARQDAAVANVGIGLANSGLNGAVGAGPLPGAPAARARPGTSAAAELARLLVPITTLDWLDRPNPYAGLAARVDVGGLRIDLAASFRGPEPTTDRGVRVRQASGVVNLGVQIEDAPGAPPPPPAASPSRVPVLATGDATALGNLATVDVSQSLRSTGPSPSAPAPSPPPPAAGPAVAAAAAVSPDGRAEAAAYASVTGSAPRETLPATGAGTGTPALVALGAALLALGVVTSACSYAPMRWRGSDAPGRVSRR